MPSWAKQVLTYGAIGALQLLVDWLIFVALTLGGFPVVRANLLARVSGALLGYVLNGRITFSGQEFSMGPAAFRRFVLVWVVLTGISSLAVHVLDANVGLTWAWAAKPIVDAALAVVGFVASRCWIYAARRAG